MIELWCTNQEFRTSRHNRPYASIRIATHTHTHTYVYLPESGFVQHRCAQASVWYYSDGQDRSWHDLLDLFVLTILDAQAKRHTSDRTSANRRCFHFMHLLCRLCFMKLKVKVMKQSLNHMHVPTNQLPFYMCTQRDIHTDLFQSSSRPNRMSLVNTNMIEFGNMIICLGVDRHSQIEWTKPSIHLSLDRVWSLRVFRCGPFS